MKWFYQAVVLTIFFSGILLFSGVQPQTNSVVPHVVIFDIHGVLADPHNKLIPEGALLLQKCAQAGHTIMILSNGNRSTIGHLFLKYYHEIIRYIKPEHILVAGVTKKVKPANDAYQHALNLIAQDPVHAGKKPKVVFIDDIKTNVDAACKNGIYGLHLTNHDYVAIERQLQLLKILT